MERMILGCKTLMMRASIAKLREEPAQVMKLYEAALLRQKALLTHLRGEHVDVVSEHHQLACEIACRVAELHSSERRFPEALVAYQDALSLQATYLPAMLALAHMHLSAGKLDDCQAMVRFALCLMDKGRNDCCAHQSLLVDALHSVSTDQYHGSDP